ncbi:MAG TPA: alpha/beta hydrolase domain-containing protein [Solirubrobacteraceae bacterium]
MSWSGRRRSFIAIAVGAGLGVAAPASASGGSGSGTPLPHVTGPLPVSATSYPFGAADRTLVPEDLSKVGYVEEEYLVSGKANVYSWPAPGPAVVRTPDAPYTTRILVRRPAKASRFSGNVVVEMLNPSNRFDLNIGWAMAHRQMVRNGDAWVGITDKPIDVLALKKFDPVRYASLSFANPLALDDPRNCQNPVTSVDPPQFRSRATEDGLAWDIYSQVGALVRSRDRANPLAYGGGRHGWSRGHRAAVQHVYGFGYSQTGGDLYDYINAIHPLDVARNGRPIYDGYIVAVAGGAFVGIVPINQCEPPPTVGDPRLQFSNVGVPIIHVMSQSDYLFGIAARRPDSDAPADRFRHYEMAGAAHATPDELNFAATSADIVKAGVPVPPMNCNEGPRSRFPSRIFFDAIVRNLDLWVRYGISPPHADPIAVQNGAGVLDPYGNVVGGLRSPYVDVPTSTWFGNSTGASFCIIAGHEVPFDAARLQQLYPTHGAYVRAVAKDTARLVAGRYITAYDGLDVIREAAQANVP